MKQHIYALILLVSGLIHATGQENLFRRYSTAEGLPHSYIYDLKQDGDGFLWLGTTEGLYRFNGFEFQIYTQEDGLGDNFISTLYTDSNGELWIGHQNGSISHRVDTGFLTFRDSMDISGAISCITEDEKGNIWITAQNKGLLYINDRGELTPVRIPMKHDRFTQLRSMGEDQFLIGSHSGIYLSTFDRSSNSMLGLTRIKYAPSSKVVGILPESDTSYTVLSENGGICGIQVDNSVDGIALFVLDDNANGHLDNLQGGLLDSEGFLWVYSMGNGVFRYMKEPDGAFKPQRHFKSENGLSSDNVRSLFEDAEGNLWFGMYGEGLLKYLREKLEFFQLGKEEESQGVSAIASRNGRFLVASGQELLELSQHGDSVYQVHAFPGKTSGDKVNSAFVSADGSLWLGFEKSGLFVADPPGFEFRAQYLSKDDLANSVNHITGSAEYLWIATKKGICRINHKQGSQDWITSEQGLPHNNIKHLYIDSKGRVLVATPCSELYYVTDSMEVAVVENSWIGPYNRLTSIQEDQDGNLWLGTHGNGVWKIEPEGILNFNRSYGLHSDFCYSIALTQAGELLTGHRGGLSLIRSESKRIKTFDRLSGIHSDMEVYPNAAHADQRGNIWLGTSKGLIKYAVGATKGDFIAPKLHIDAVYLNGEKIDHKAGLVVKRPGQYELLVEYTGLHLSNPEMVIYQTKLEGFSKEWSIPSAKRHIVYERISHGHYSFHMRAYNENDIQSEAFSLFEIRIKKPVYLQVWFYLVLVFMLAGIFYAVIRIRERNHRMIQERLLKNLDEKTKEIIVKEEIIKERKKVEKVLIQAKTRAEESDRLKTSFLQNISHEIRTPMNAIVGFTQLLKEDNYSVEDRDDFIQRVAENADSLLKLVDNTIEFSELHAKQVDLNPTVIQVNPFMDEAEKIALQHLEKQGKGGLELRKICPGEPTLAIKTDYALLKQVMDHLIDNAVKFTDKGSITLGYQREDLGVVFYVEDSGIGLSEELKDVVFELFLKVENEQNRLYSGTGLGLTLTKYLIQTLGGEIMVDSEPGKGSKFYFIIPFQTDE